MPHGRIAAAALRALNLALDRPRQNWQPLAMAKTRTSYVCQNCGAITQRWQGKCESCGEWNTIIEEGAALGIGAASARRGAAGRPFPLEDLSGDSRPEARVVTGIAELDRVAGGGFVPGSATLIGGEPGIGKSTLLIQACGGLGAARRPRRLCLGRGIDRAGAPARVAARPFRFARPTGGADAASRTSSRRSAPATRRNSSSSIPSRPCGATQSNRRRAPSARCGEPRRRSSVSPRRAAPRCCWSVMSPRTARSPARASSSTWSTRSSRSRATARTLSVSCARPRIASAPTDEVGVFEMTGAGLAEVRQSLRPVPGRPRRREPGRGGFRRRRGRAPAAGRDPGAGRADAVWARRAGRWSAGSRAGSPWSWRCWRRTPGSSSASSTSISMSPGGLRIARAGGRSRGGGGAGLLAGRRQPAARRGLFRRDRAFGRGARRRPYGSAGSRRRRSSGFASAVAPAHVNAEGEPSRIAISPVGSVASLVAAIAASGVEARSAPGAGARAVGDKSAAPAPPARNGGGGGVTK